MTEQSIAELLEVLLAEYGIPKDAIYREMRVNLGSDRRFKADLLVASEDRNLPLYLFEVKAKGLRNSETLRCAYRTYDGIASILPCFVVVEEGGAIFVSRIGVRGCAVWVDISDKKDFARLLGDYWLESQRVIDLCKPETPELRRQDLKKFRDGLTGGATVVLLVMFLVEIVARRTVSYQLAGLVALVFVFYAASYGIIKELKFKGLELSFCSQEGRHVVS